MEDRKGFTLIEIIAVVIIIGVLALIVVPSVSGYISSSRKTAYTAHEKSMEEAAKSMTIEVINGKDNFSLPKKGNYTNVTLKELVDKELIKSLQDPQTGEKCNEDMSYVVITGKTDTSYTYKACLYCGGYVTESDECVGSSTDDSTPPVCGTITGESSEWTNKSRTISVECSDPDSGCKRSRYSQTFNSTMETGEISIYNSANMETKCPVTVKVDKNKPTCELQIVGDDNTETTGWTSGRNVTVKMISYTDGANESGISTYGMGTSSKKPNYNALTSYEITNITGTTTIFGYVKDNAGNEGMCYTTVTTGLEKPIFDVRYGYQIYPEKERFETNNVSITDTNKLKTTSNNPTITFNHMDKYKNVTAMIVDLSTEISDPMSWKLTVGSNTYTADAESTTRLRFNIETEPSLNNVSSSNKYTLTLGNIYNKEYTINRIEIEQVTGNVLSRYNVAVNLRTRRQVVRTTKWSWDNGSHWDTKYYSTFDIRNSAKSGTAIIQNDVPLVSNTKSYSIIQGDAILPSLTVTPNTTAWTNQNVLLTAKSRDTNAGIIGHIWSTSDSVSYYDNNWDYYDIATTDERTFTKSIEKNGTNYIYVKDDAGNVSVNSVNVTNIDKLKPICSAITGNGNEAKISCSDPAANSSYGQSKLVKYYFGTKSEPTDSDFTSITETDKYETTKTVSAAGTYYLFAKDKAGNISDVKSDSYYAITYNGNGATTAGTASGIVRYKSTSLSTITNPKREYKVSFDLNGTSATATTTALDAKYTLNGWYTAASDGSKVASNATTPALQANVSGYTDASKQWIKQSATTLYAQWNSASVTLPSISKTCNTCKWNTKADGTGTSYDGGSSYTPSSTHTLYAVCTPNTFTISYTYNGGTAPTSGVPASFTYGTGATVDGSPTRSGYTFNGWTLGSSNAFSHTIATTTCANQSVSALWCQDCASPISNGTCTLTATTAGTCTYTTTCNTHYHYTSGQSTRSPVCAPDSYTVTLDGNGATTAGSASTTVVHLGTSLATITNPQRAFTVSFNKNGTSATADTTALTATATLTGWYSAPDYEADIVATAAGSPALYANADGFTNAASQWSRGSGATLYAHWNDGAITLPTITKSGKVCYWNSLADGSGDDFNGGSIYYPEENETLYGKCIDSAGTNYEPKITLRKHSASLAPRCGIAGTPDKVTDGKICYTCNGQDWCTKVNGKNCRIYSFLIEPHKNKTIKKVTVKFDSKPDHHVKKKNRWTIPEDFKEEAFQGYTYFPDSCITGTSSGSTGCPEVGNGTNYNFFMKDGKVVFRFRPCADSLRPNTSNTVSGEIIVKYTDGTSGSKTFSYGIKKCESSLVVIN